jgi:hypothetical protein
MEWNHANSQRKKKFKAGLSAGKIMTTIFWDSVGLQVVVITITGTTINSDARVKTLKQLHSRIRRVRPHLRIEEVLLLRDIARPQVSLRTTEAITKLR